MKKEYNSITNKKSYIRVEECVNIDVPRYISSKNHFEEVTLSNSCLKFLTNIKDVKCKLRCDKDYKKLIISCFKGSVPEHDDYYEAIIEMPLLKGEGVNSKVYFNLGFLSESLSKFNFSMLDFDTAILKWGTDMPLFVKYKNYECMIAPIIPHQNLMFFINKGFIMCDDFEIVEKNVCSACKHSYEIYDSLSKEYENACKKKSKLVNKSGGLTTCTWWCL